MPLDARIEAIRVEYGLHESDFWQIPQNRQWVAKHAALEVVAVKAGIIFDMPQVFEANGEAGIAAVCVRGTMGNRSIWSIGEASPKNCKNSYPWAMAEKRAIDRVVLKLVGIHGLVYSEEEADDFKASKPTEAPAPKSSAALKRDGAWETVIKQITEDMIDVRTFAAFEQLKNVYREESRKNGWNRTFMEQLADHFAGLEDRLAREIEKDNLLMAGE